MVSCSTCCGIERRFVTVTTSHLFSHYDDHLAKMSMEESISLEETNKIRISLGLKPLTDDKTPVLDSEKVAENNYAKLREKEAKERETE